MCIKEVKKRFKLHWCSQLFGVIMLQFCTLNAQANESLFYEISGKGMKRTSYLFGTIHLYDPSIVQIPEELFSYIENIDELLLELSSQDAELAAEYATFFAMDTPQDSSSIALLTKESYAKLLQFEQIKVLEEYQLNYLSPIYITQFLFWDDKMKSVEKELESYARIHDKQIVSLETVKSQLQALRSISIKEQVAELEILLSKDDPQQEIKIMYNNLCQAYASQNIKELMTLQEDFNTLSKAATAALLSDRESAMAENIDEILLSGDKTIFIAVGALHLHNKTEQEGLVSRLRDKGYTLKPIKINLLYK